MGKESIIRKEWSDSTDYLENSERMELFKGGMIMYTYDFTKFFTFKVWMKEQLATHDVANMGMNALDDLKETYQKQFENELETGILKEV